MSPLHTVQLTTLDENKQREENQKKFNFFEFAMKRCKQDNLSHHIYIFGPLEQKFGTFVTVQKERSVSTPSILDKSWPRRTEIQNEDQKTQ